MPPPHTALATWDLALDRYETHLRARRASPRTISDYLRELRQLASTLEGGVAEVDLQRLREQICGLLSGTRSVSGRPLSAGAVARSATVFSPFSASGERSASRAKKRIVRSSERSPWATSASTASAEARPA